MCPSVARMKSRMKRRLVVKVRCSGAGPICSGAADLGTQGGFLRQGNARAAERPARSQQLLQQMLMRPGCCQSNGGHPHTYRSHVGEWGVLVTRSAAIRAGKQSMARQTGHGVAVCAAVDVEWCAGRALSPYQLKR